jgi:hypothetical protein
MKPPVKDSLPQWEYLVINCQGQSDEKDQRAMNECGLLRWELVSMSKGVAYFKRIKL